MTKTNVKLKNGKTVSVSHKVAETLQGKELGKIVKPKAKPKAKKA